MDAKSEQGVIAVSDSPRVLPRCGGRFLRTLRWVHRWVGLAATLPCILVAGTGLLLVHPSWYEWPKRPEYPAAPLDPTQAAAVFHKAIEEAYGSTHGFCLKQVDVRFDRKTGWMVIVKGGRPEDPKEKQFVQVIDPEFSPQDQPEVSPSSARGGSPQVKKIVKDLHTGKIFGASFAWIWADGLALVLTLLTLTGIILAFPTLFGNRRKAAAGDTGLIPESENPGRAT